MTHNLALIEAGGVEGIDAVRCAIRAAENADEALENVARVAAAKAWAKAHGQLREHRLMLLGLEVEALIMVIRLGGGSMLSASDRKAGEWLAAKSADEIATLLATSGQTTTASGMCREVWRAEQAAGRAATRRAFGARWASGDRSFREELDEALEVYAKAGEPFEVADIANDVASGIIAPDDEFMEGVREACRTALRKAPTDSVAGTVIPRFVTTRMPDGTWVRVPALHATVGDARAMLDLRRRQLADDQAACDRLAAFVAKLATYAHSDDDVVGDVLAASISPAPAA